MFCCWLFQLSGLAHKQLNHVSPYIANLKTCIHWRWQHHWHPTVRVVMAPKLEKFADSVSTAAAHPTTLQCFSKASSKGTSTELSRLTDLSQDRQSLHGRGLCCPKPRWAGEEGISQARHSEQFRKSYTLTLPLGSPQPQKKFIIKTNKGYKSIYVNIFRFLFLPSPPPSFFKGKFFW